MQIMCCAMDSTSTDACRHTANNTLLILEVAFTVKNLSLSLAHCEVRAFSFSFSIFQAV